MLVFRVDRFSRSLGQLAALIEEFEKSGVTFQSMTEPFETATPARRMMLQMLGVFAEIERASIVDTDVFEGAQRLRAGRARKPAQRRTNASPFLLSGLHLICERCGSPLVGTTAHTRARRNDYYTCATRSRHGTAACDQDCLRRDQLEAAILGQPTARCCAPQSSQPNTSRGPWRVTAVVGWRASLPNGRP